MRGAAPPRSGASACASAVLSSVSVAAGEHGQEQAVAGQRPAHLREQAGQVVDPLQRQRAHHEIERFGARSSRSEPASTCQPTRAIVPTWPARRERIGERRRGRAEIGGAQELALDGGEAAGEVGDRLLEQEIGARHGQAAGALLAERAQAGIEDLRRGQASSRIRVLPPLYGPPRLPGQSRFRLSDRRAHARDIVARRRCRDSSSARRHLPSGSPPPGDGRSIVALLPACMGARAAAAEGGALQSPLERDPLS